MKRHLLLPVLCSVLVFSHAAQAQVGDIIGASMDIGSGCADGCGDGCADAGYFMACDNAFWTFAWLTDLQDGAMNRDYIEGPVSVDLMFHYSRDPRSYKTTGLIPRIRVNWGAFSFDFRHTVLSDSTGTLQMTDMLPMVFNLASNEHVVYRLGAGISTYSALTNDNETSSAVYGQIHSSLEFSFADGRFAPMIDGRVDIGENALARKEFNAKLGYRLTSNKWLSIYGDAGYTYQSFYPNIELHYYSFGLRANVH
jgi:hypothetical protein